MADGRKMTARIPLTPETKRLLRAFLDGTGGTYDDFLRYILQTFGVDASDSEAEAISKGLSLRETLQEWIDEQP